MRNRIVVAQRVSPRDDGRPTGLLRKVKCELLSRLGIAVLRYKEVKDYMVGPGPETQFAVVADAIVPPEVLAGSQIRSASGPRDLDVEQPSFGYI